MPGRIAYFDCFNGAGGDMIVAALIDAGADGDALRTALRSLAPAGYELNIAKVNKQGFASTRFDVQLTPTEKQPHRHLKHVVEIIERGDLPATVRKNATAVFTRLAQAEATVHGCSIEKVHFHEVGAIDAILDVVGATLALHSLGIERMLCSAIPVGSGTVKCEHGVMPVPAPATAELLKGVPIQPTEETGELTTPTAAAILTTLAESFGPVPAMAINAVGYGAGTRDGKSRPNVLRVLIGEPAERGVSDAADTIAVLEANVDDSTPEVVGYCIERLLAAGALDAYAVPIQGKKSRPGLVLTVLCEPARAAEMEGLIFAETTTFGVRRHLAERAKMQRTHVTVQTPYGPIRIKSGSRGETTTRTPEFEDCRAAAQTHGVPLRVVMDAARRAADA